MHYIGKVIPMRNVLLMLACAIAFASCNPNRIYKDHQALSPNVEWLKKDARTFKVPIQDTSATYNLFIAFRYANGIPYRDVLVNLDMKLPSGKSTSSKHKLTIVDEKGDYIGDGSVDIWDSEHLIWENKKFSATGYYEITLSHEMPAENLIYAMEIGIVVDKVPQVGN